MIVPICECCNEELEEPGAILMAPPDLDRRCLKIHLCITCFRLLAKGLYE